MKQPELLGAHYLNHCGTDGCRFAVWAPDTEQVEVHVVAPHERLVGLTRAERGYHHAVIEGVKPGVLYRYRLDGQLERPDPASRFQPQGVHGPSQVVDGDFVWDDAGWSGLPLEDSIFYELHVGTFTPDGTFAAILAQLDGLIALGITAIELMPVAQFPGERNWGYDGVFPFAVQASYGGPHGLKQLVNACHQRGLAVVLDVVYNHLGPEGNYLGDFGPYFTDRYKTPWGLALNFDGPHSDEVRRFFIENALSWMTEFHIDALRLDAVHAIMDQSAYPFLKELAAAVHKRARQLGRRCYTIAESDLNDARLIRSRGQSGYGLDAQWSDDFHHALHTLLTGERSGYYADFGQLDHFVRALENGFVYTGDYSVHRQRRHGNASRALPAQRFVVCAQNHDQIGNRMLGERLSQLVSFAQLKLAAGAVLCAPFLPLLFMGEEYAETAPFQYFVSHSEPDLVEAVRHGRQAEFAAFDWQGQKVSAPDPQDPATFQRSTVNQTLRQHGQHRTLLAWYTELIRLRKQIPALAHVSKDDLEILSAPNQLSLLVRRWHDSSEVFVVLHFGRQAEQVSFPLPSGHWQKILDAEEEQWQGQGSRLPQQLTSQASVSLDLSPYTYAVFGKLTHCEVG